MSSTDAVDGDVTRTLINKFQAFRKIADDRLDGLRDYAEELKSQVELLQTQLEEEQEATRAALRDRETLQYELALSEERAKVSPDSTIGQVDNLHAENRELRKKLQDLQDENQRLRARALKPDRDVPSPTSTQPQLPQMSASTPNLRSDAARGNAAVGNTPPISPTRTQDSVMPDVDAEDPLGETVEDLQAQVLSLRGDLKRVCLSLQREMRQSQRLKHQLKQVSAQKTQSSAENMIACKVRL
eukprot:Rmarinus@m.10821